MGLAFQAHLTVQLAHQVYQPSNKCIDISDETEQIMILHTACRDYVRYIYFK